MKQHRILTAAAVTIGLLGGGGGVASAYQPAPADVYVATNPTACNKNPCVLYPKSAQLPSGRIVATFEDSQSEVVGQTLPVFTSDDDGATWQKRADVKAPAYLSSDPDHAKYTSNWTNAYPYVLPQDIGALKAGTLLVASMVSGDDAYYNEHKAIDPNWQPTGDGDRQDIAIALYASTDEGVTWTFNSIIADGGWQGGSAGHIGRTSAANVHRQVDPLWEPHLLAREGKLIAYYSDENDYLGFDPNTGVPILDPENDTAPDSHGQILVHKTWDGNANTSWSQPVVDIAGFTQDRGNGKTQIGGGRPGMTTIAPTTDGKWLLTYEYFGGGDNVHYMVSDNPLRFYAAGDADADNISALPVPSGQRTPATGGSPVLINLPDGRIVYNAAGSGSVWVNESGRSDGTWKEYQTPMPGGYSRNLQYVDATGRLLILQAGWGGGSIGPVKFGEVDLGRSKGTYTTLMNRLTGQVLTPQTGKTQDANLTGNVPDLVLGPRNASDASQRWHVTPKGDAVTLLNETGGRAAGIWTGTATAGQRLAQWADDNATDKQWTLVPSAEGFVKIQSVQNPQLFMTGSTADSHVTLGAALDAAGNPSSDDAQEWHLIDAVPPPASLALKGEQSGRCLDVPWGQVGVQVQIYDCIGNSNQRITQTTAGELRVAGNCLGAEASGTTPGTRVILWPCDGTGSQKWAFRNDGTIANKLSGLVLDVTAYQTANFSPVQLWTGVQGSNQRWTPN